MTISTTPRKPARKPMTRAKQPQLKPVIPVETEDYREVFEVQLPLIRAAKKGDPEALVQLEVLSRNLRRSKAQRFLPNRPDLHEDAIQSAWTGVLNALRKWDESWRRLFLAYAHWDISEAIREFKYEMELTVCRPTHMHRKLSKLTKYNTSDVDELAELSGLTSESVKGIMAIKHGDVSLHQYKLDHEEDIGNRFIMEQDSDEATPVQALDQADLLKLLDDAMGILDEREAHVVMLYYHTDSTFGQIAETMNLTRQRVEQINASAIQKLQRYFLTRDPDLVIALKHQKALGTKRGGREALGAGRNLMAALA